MAVTIHWKPVENAAKIRLYQSNKKFGIVDIGVRQDITVAELPPDTIEQVVSIARNTVNFFLISGVDVDGLEMFGDVFSFGNFPNTGPGSDVIQRGTWEFGWFGEVKLEELFTGAELGAQLTSKNFINDIVAANLTLWNKCIVNGKILFIPNKALFQMPPAGAKATLLTQRGLSMTAGFPDAPVFNKNGNDFIYRLPLPTLNNPAGGLSVPVINDNVWGSEIGMIAACSLGGANRFSKVAPNPQGGAYNVMDTFSDCASAAAGSADGSAIGTANWTAQKDGSSWTVFVMYPNDTGTPSFNGRQWFWDSYVSLGTFLVQPVLELAF